MIDTKARTIPKLEALIGEEVEIGGKRYWVSGCDCYPDFCSIQFSSEPPPEWLTR